LGSPFDDTGTPTDSAVRAQLITLAEQTVRFARMHSLYSSRPAEIAALEVE